MLKPDYRAILNLLIAYDQQLTLSRDEFDAVEHYQACGYGLQIIESFYKHYPILPQAPKGYLCYELVPSGNDEASAYYLVKAGV